MDKTGRFPPSRKYCSLACSERAPRPDKATGEEKLCAVCGVAVYIAKSRLGLPHYFCSQKHANDWQARTKVSLRCSICKIAFIVSPVNADRKYCSLACRDADPERHEQLVRMLAMQRNGMQTRIEVIGYGLLDEMGEVYFRQHTIGGKFTVDAFVPNAALVVQFDGDYWHGNPDKFPVPDARQKRRMHMDASQDAYMRACGYRVARFWETDIHRHIGHVRSSLRALI